jgi:hypothetical protein
MRFEKSILSQIFSESRGSFLKFSSIQAEEDLFGFIVKFMELLRIYLDLWRLTWILWIFMGFIWLREIAGGRLRCDDRIVGPD